MLSRAERDDGIRTAAARLHRLDARAGLRADVPDALLRFVARRRGAGYEVHGLVTAGWNAARSAVSLPCRNFLRAADGPDAAKRIRAGSHRGQVNSARGGNLRARAAFSRAGVHSRPAVGAVDRSTPRGRAECDRNLADAHGGGEWAGANSRGQYDSGGGGRAGDCARDSAALDHVAAAMAAVVPGVVYQWRPHFQSAAAVAIPD